MISQIHIISTLIPHIPTLIPRIPIIALIPFSQFSILAFTDSQTFMIKCSKLFVRRAANQIGNNTIGKNIVEYIILL